MASPLFDALSVQHSRNIGDKVASASTDGPAITSAMRSTHLNKAIRKFIELNVGLKNYDAIRQYVYNTTGSLSSNVYALTTPTPDVAWVIGVADTTLSPTRTAKPLPQEYKQLVSEGADNSYLTASSTNLYYLTEGTNLRLLGAGASDAIAIRYVGVHRDMSAGDSTADIAIDSQYFETILSLALYFAMNERPSQENVARAQSAYQIAIDSITGVAQSHPKGN